jgi:hypothetical protein
MKTIDRFVRIDWWDLAGYDVRVKIKTTLVTNVIGWIETSFRRACVR